MEYLTHWQFYLAVAVAAVVVNFIWKFITGGMKGKLV